MNSLFLFYQYKTFIKKHQYIPTHAELAKALATESGIVKDFGIGTGLIDAPKNAIRLHEIAKHIDEQIFSNSKF